MATNIDRALEPSLIPGREPDGVQEMDTIEIEIENPDSVTVGVDGLEVTLIPGDDDLDEGFAANLAETMDEGALQTLA
ncbi:MAG: hypothetical protein ACO3VO_10575, partial [Ilumatobacteraceae bacterium]